MNPCLYFIFACLIGVVIIEGREFIQRRLSRSVRR